MLKDSNNQLELTIPASLNPLITSGFDIRWLQHRHQLQVWWLHNAHFVVTWVDFCIWILRELTVQTLSEYHVWNYRRTYVFFCSFVNADIQSLSVQLAGTIVI